MAEGGYHNPYAAPSMDDGAGAPAGYGSLQAGGGGPAVDGHAAAAHAVAIGASGGGAGLSIAPPGTPDAATTEAYVAERMMSPGAVEAAVWSEAAMAGKASVPDALARHQFIEYDVPRELYAGGVEEPLTTVLRYYPSHVPYRVPPNMRVAGRPKIRVMIVVTMYAEDPDELTRTLEGIAKNVTNMNADHSTDKPNGLPWQEVLVCVVSDGHDKINTATLRCAEELGMVRESLIFTAARGCDFHNPSTGETRWLQLVDPDTVQMHAFEFAPQLRPSSSKLRKEYGNLYAPLQCVFAIKQNNGGKLDSHKWFFDAFCAPLNPEFVTLVDVGTMPSPRSIQNLVSCMRNNRHIGGCCGEIAVGSVESGGKGGGNRWTNFVVAAQMFEYKISHAMDKTLESWLGFITVLPGAFSAYRYAALAGDGTESSRYRPPLDKYFKSLPDPHTGRFEAEAQSTFDANMYLAEDRILCFEIVASAGKRYTLHYQKNAVAYTDVPSELASLLKQRRRWLNGSFFAMLYSLANFSRVFTEAQHSTGRKVLLMLELVYFMLSVVVTWFIIGSFYLSFYLIIDSTFGADNCAGDSTLCWSTVLESVLTFVYLVVTASVCVLSLGNDAIAARKWFRLCAYAYAAIVILTTSVSVFHLVRDAASQLVVLAAMMLFLVYFFSAALHGQLPWIVGSFLQYYVMLPTFINIFTIYSFSNIHDVSWGTKGIEAATSKTVGKKSGRVDVATQEALNEQQAHEAQLERERIKERAAESAKREHSFKGYRTSVVLLMLACNWAYVQAVEKFVLATGHTQGFVLFLGVMVLGLLFIRLAGSILYQVERLVKATCARGYVDNQRMESRRALLDGHRAGMRGGAAA